MSVIKFEIHFFIIARPSCKRRISVTLKRLLSHSHIRGSTCYLLPNMSLIQNSKFNSNPQPGNQPSWLWDRLTNFLIVHREGLPHRDLRSLWDRLTHFLIIHSKGLLHRDLTSAGVLSTTNIWLSRPNNTFKLIHIFKKGRPLLQNRRNHSSRISNAKSFISFRFPEELAAAEGGFLQQCAGIGKP